MREILRWTGRILAVLLLLVVLAAAGLYATSSYRLNQTYDVDVGDITIPSDSAVVTRGRHIAVTRGCADCHGSTLAGSTAVEDPMIGTLHAPNLTPAGVGNKPLLGCRLDTGPPARRGPRRLSPRLHAVLGVLLSERRRSRRADRVPQTASSSRSTDARTQPGTDGAGNGGDGTGQLSAIRSPHRS